MREELKDLCDNLTIPELIEMKDYLSVKIKYAPWRCAILMGEMREAMGVDSLSTLSRKANDVWGRTMVAYQMSMEGFTTIEIGRQMMKDHATIIHYRNKMMDVFAYPEGFRDILEIWDKFQKRIKK